VSAVAVVTDSTADLTELAAPNGIEVVPLTVSFGGESYQDGVDLSRDEFYRKLASSAQPPTTAQPAPAAFAATYRRLLGGGATGILSLHISSKLSGTYAAALAAANEVDAQRIRVIDSTTVSLGLGLLALQAAADARTGAPLDSIAGKAAAAARRVELFATIPSLTYLARGGRIGRLQGILGNVLKVVPIITLRDGELAEYSKVRTFTRAVDQMVAIVTGRLSSSSQVAVLHSVAPELAQSVVDRIQRHVRPARLVCSGVGPTVGTHAGPGAVGVAFIL
jgi:DegV family protein with EDD domain